jgi:hypothetical protein
LALEKQGARSSWSSGALLCEHGDVPPSYLQDRNVFAGSAIVIFSRTLHHGVLDLGRGFPLVYLGDEGFAVSMSKETVEWLGLFLFGERYTICRGHAVA